MSTRSPRIAIGRFWQETNTFSDAHTSLADYRRYTFLTGEAMLAAIQSADDELAGFEDVLRETRAACVPLIAASTWCGGPVLPEVIDAVTKHVRCGLREAGELDAVLFSMHGALAGDDTPDVTGHLLQAIRAQIGEDIPLVVTLDHHANVTLAMIHAADVMTAYRHCPHSDMRQTGQRGARMLLDLLDDRSKPTVAYHKLPMITPCEAFRTDQTPMKGWFDLAAEMRERPGVVDAQCYPVQPWIDSPELGWSAVVVTHDDPDTAQQLCSELAEYAWLHRREFFVKKHDPGEAVRIAAAHPQGPVVIADGADATNGGSPGDSTCLLDHMLDQRITCPALMTMVDAAAVEVACQAGLSATITIDLGAKFSSRFCQPLRVVARVARFTNGRFTIAGHLAANVNMGRCAVLEIGSIRILVSEHSGPGHDPQVFRHAGLEPGDAQIVVVKATVGHIDAYRDIMRLNLPTECDGPSPSYLDRLQYRRIPRPMFPFDPDTRWSPWLSAARPVSR